MMRHSARIRFVRGAFSAAFLMFAAASVSASTYAVYIPLDSSIYQELDTLDGIGVLDSYIAEIKPISRVEAARLTLEAESKLRGSDDPNPLARQIVRTLRDQLHEEIGWVEEDGEDNLPTMVHPIERVEGQYIYSSGKRRQLATGDSGINFREATPLLPYNDNLSTADGSNEALRWSAWAGIGGFIAGYGEGAIAGPMEHELHAINRTQLLTGAAVVGLGNVAVSFGQEEMAWGPGRFGLLSQSNNALPFPALRAQNIHPSHLPGILRYLGLFRWQAFFGQLDSDRQFSRPWIDGQILSFKPLPWVEYGFTHAITFGGSGNDNYGLPGFVGRATGFDTGNPGGANTNSRLSAYLTVRIPQLRNTSIYGELLGEDFFQPFGPGIGIKTPFKAPSYQLGISIPQLTEDGRTTAILEYTVLDRVYSTHNDSLYWTYQNALMGDALGPGAWRLNMSLGRWLDYQSKLDVGAYYTQRIPLPIIPPTAPANNERSLGISLDFMHLPVEIHRLGDSLGEMRAATAVEYVSDINYSNQNSLRAMVQISVGFTPSWNSLTWR